MMGGLIRGPIRTALLLFPLAVPAPSPAQTARRGPAEVRDEQLLAQPRLTLPALSPDPTPLGRWSFSASVLVSNTFSWKQDEAGETPNERTFLIDGEAATLDLQLRRGLGRSLDVGLRLPVRSRGGGDLDGLIDWWHDAFDLLDASRPDFRRDAFRIEGQTRAELPFSWSERDGSGLGNVELDARWRLVDQGRDAASLALVVRGALPTGTGPFAGHSGGVGLQATLGIPLGDRFDLYTGLGGTWQGAGPVDGIDYTPVRAHLFLAIEWRPWRRFSLVAETDAATRLVENVRAYPGAHWIAHVAGRLDLGARARLDLGFTENFQSQFTTTDFALYAGLALRP